MKPSVEFTAAMLGGVFLMIDRLDRAKPILTAYLAMVTMLAVTLPLAWHIGQIDLWSGAVALGFGTLLLAGAVRALFTDRFAHHLPIYVTLILYASVSFYRGLQIFMEREHDGTDILYALCLLLVTCAFIFAVVHYALRSIRNAGVRLQSIVHNTSYGLAFLAEDGELLEINGRMLKILGTPWDLAHQGIPKLAQSGLLRLEPCLSQGWPGGELNYQRADCMGMRRLIVTTRRIDSGLGGQPGVFVQVEDVTESRRALRELEGYKRRMDMMFQSINAFEFFRRGDRMYASMLYAMLGYPVESMKLEEFLALIHPQDYHERVPPNKEEIRFRHADGHYLWFLVNGREEELDGEHLSTGIMICIDEIKRMERQMAQSEKLSALGQLAGGVAHDMNNHLMTMQTSLNLLNKTGDEVLRRKYTDYLQEAINNSAALLRSLLSFSRGQQEAYAPVALDEMVGLTVGLLERALTAKVILRWEDSAGPATMLGNYYELQNALLNLGLNARDAMEPSGGELRVHTWIARMNPMQADHDGPWYCLSVSDEGCGMDAALQRKIFDPFFTTKTNDRGSGLGLSITYGIVKRHGGTIGVESQPGRGSTFTLCFPLAQVVPLPERQIEAKPATGAKPADGRCASAS